MEIRVYGSVKKGFYESEVYVMLQWKLCGFLSVFLLGVLLVGS